MEPILSETERGKPSLIITGYIYGIGRYVKKTDETYWRCTKNSCRAIVYTRKTKNTVSVLRYMWSHNHKPADDRRICRKVILQTVKRRVELNPYQNPSKILKMELKKLRGFGNNLQAEDIGRIRRNMNNARRQKLKERQMKLDTMGNTKKQLRKHKSGDQKATYTIGNIKVEPLEIVNNVDFNEEPMEDPLLCNDLPNVEDTRIIFDQRKEVDDRSFSYNKPTAYTSNGYSLEAFNERNYIDEDKAFLLSILPMMKELNGEQKMEFKMYILDQLRKLRYPKTEPCNKFKVVNVPNIQNSKNEKQQTTNQQHAPHIETIVIDQPTSTSRNTKPKSIPKSRKVNVQHNTKRTIKRRQQKVNTSINQARKTPKRNQRKQISDNQDTEPLVIMCVAADEPSVTPISDVGIPTAQMPSNTTARVYRTAKRKFTETLSGELSRRGVPKTTTILKPIQSIVDNKPQHDEPELQIISTGTLDTTTDSLEMQMDFEEVKLECVKEELLTKMSESDNTSKTQNTELTSHQLNS